MNKKQLSKLLEYLLLALFGVCYFSLMAFVPVPVYFLVIILSLSLLSVIILKDRELEKK